MNDSRIVSIAQIKEFIKVAGSIDFKGASRQEKYAWLENILIRFRYLRLKKNEKSTVKDYLIN